MHSALQAPAEVPARRPGVPWSLKEWPAFVGISKSTAERRLRDGTVPSFKIGARRLVADAVVQALVKGQPLPQ